ncbi:hypothetical protein [Pseudomonas sp. UBA7530]|uniref:hypothetical protein n=1 Tax=Pseudomonas sp. UBA7530 TaxID=1947341 RepID=UPI0025EB2AAB|nr:hypothetical protein [Pseudomonas sp. UBA7530]
MAVSVIAKFIADEWFKIMAILCFLVLIAGLTMELKVDNLVVVLASLAGVFYGLAEMAFRPYREEIVRNPFHGGYAKLSGRPRRINASGCMLTAIAFAWMCAAIWRGWVVFAPPI